MSTRLTNAIRDEIVKNAITKTKFNERIKEKEQEGELILFKLLMEYHGGEEAYRKLERQVREIRTKINNLRDKNVNVEFGLYSGWNHNFNLGGRTVSLPSMDSLPANYSYLLRLAPRERIVFPANHKLVEAYFTIQDEVKELETSRDKVRQEVKAMVYSVNTTKRLVEVWPESAELIPAANQVAKVGLPAINVASLNAAIGIPTPPEKE